MLLHCFARPDNATDHVAMNITGNLTGMVSEVPQDGPESGLTSVFLGVVAGNMIVFLAGTFWAWRKDQEEKEMVSRFLDNVARF